MAEPVDLLVIGAGPAGLSAAIAAAGCGARVVIIDEHAQPGGQYFAQRLPGADPAPALTLTQEAARLGVSLRSATAVIGAEGLERILLSDREGLTQLACRSVVIATGAYDRAIAFPGWDLPGVLTPGGAQRQVKMSGRPLPGRVVLAGSGPFLLPVARTLSASNGQLTRVFEMGRPLSWASQSSILLKHPEKAAELAGYASLMLRRRVPFSFGWRVARAEGEERVERVVMTRCRPDGTSLPGTEKTLETDFLCVGYGFVTSIHISDLFGCAHEWEPSQGGWVVQHDSTMRTTVPSVFVAGESAGVGGIDCALAEGELAGLHAAAALGFQTSASRIEKAQRRRTRARRFAAAIAKLFPVRPALYEAISDDTLICRCENVTAADIRWACDPWLTSVTGIKITTRCGMGRCQGRTCGHQVAALAASCLGREVSTFGRFTTRFPLSPTSASSLARMHD